MTEIPSLPPTLGFAEDPIDHVFRRPDTVTVAFAMTTERYERDQFQKHDQRFVPRMIDRHGRERDWEGPLVFVGIVHFEMRDAGGTLQDRRQILRVFADSQSELSRLMAERIRETFFANFLAQTVQSSAAMDLKRLHEENIKLRERLGELM
jgi:hypothetical protein